MTLNIYISVAKGLKLKVRKFLGLIPTFVEVTGEKMVGAFVAPFQNRVAEEALVRRKFHEFLKIFFKGLLDLNPLNSETF